MKKLSILVSALMLCSSSFAAPISALGSAWKSYHAIHPKQDKNDVEMVYGGEDVSVKSLLTHQTTAV